MSFSLVERTLFEANSRARHPEKKGFTSVQTSGLIPACPYIVNPGRPKIARKRAAPGFVG